MNRSEIKDFFEKNSFQPLKSMGQNFLVDESVLEKIIKAGEISSKDKVIEVGAGAGMLTKALAKKAKSVIAIEKDKKIIPLLEKAVEDFSNIKIKREDILSYRVKEKNYKVIANVPYYITSPIIRKFLEEKNPPSLLVLTLQKEVAERIKAKTPRMNLLAVSVQLYANVEIVSHVPPSAFYPSPSVTSSIIKIKPCLQEETLNQEFRKIFFQIVKAGFSSPRKQLKNNLAFLDKGRGKEIELKNINIEELLKETGIDPKRRAETLSIEEWKNLTKKIRK